MEYVCSKMYKRSRSRFSSVGSWKQKFAWVSPTSVLSSLQLAAGGSRTVPAAALAIGTRGKRRASSFVNDQLVNKHF